MTCVSHYNKEVSQLNKLPWVEAENHQAPCAYKKKIIKEQLATKQLHWAGQCLGVTRVLPFPPSCPLSCFCSTFLLFVS